MDPDNDTMTPAMETVNPRYPARRAQTAILQYLLLCSSGGSSAVPVTATSDDSAHHLHPDDRERTVVSDGNRPLVHSVRFDPRLTLPEQLHCDSTPA